MVWLSVSSLVVDANTVQNHTKIGHSLPRKLTMLCHWVCQFTASSYQERQVGMLHYLNCLGKIRRNTKKGTVAYFYIRS